MLSWIRRRIQKGEKLILMMPKVQQQQDGTSCGFHAVANLVAVALGLDPQMQKYDSKKLRPSLNEFLKNAELQSFPKLRGRLPASQPAVAIEI